MDHNAWDKMAEFVVPFNSRSTWDRKSTRERKSKTVWPGKACKIRGLHRKGLATFWKGEKHVRILLSERANTVRTFWPRLNRGWKAVENLLINCTCAAATAHQPRLKQPKRGLIRALFQLHINHGWNNRKGVWPAHYFNCTSTAVETTEKGFGLRIISTAHQPRLKQLKQL